MKILDWVIIEFENNEYESKVIRFSEKVKSYFSVIIFFLDGHHAFCF